MVAALAVVLPLLLLVPFIQTPVFYALIAGVALVAAAAMAAAVHVALPLVHELTVARTRARRLATHDVDTGVVNQRHFAQLAQREWERCRRYRSGATMLIVEVDHLDTVSDEHGRAACAAVLRTVALACDSTLRKSDLLGRHSGDVMAAFLPHTETLGAVDVAERLRAMVAESTIPWHRNSIRVTLSIGVASLGDAHMSLAAFMLEAETALQAAQKAGRNCVRVSPQRGSRSSRDYPVMG